MINFTHFLQNVTFISQCIIVVRIYPLLEDRSYELELYKFSYQSVGRSLIMGHSRKLKARSSGALV